MGKARSIKKLAEQKRPRKYTATLHRHTGSGRKTAIVWARHFSEFDNMVKRCSELAVYECWPKDRIEFSLKDHGDVVGYLQVHAGGTAGELNWDGLKTALAKYARLLKEFEARPGRKRK